jgi:alkylhydroperoxidase family enzyme
MLGDEALVQEVLRDPATSRLDARHKAIFRFVDRVNDDSPNMTAEDAAEAREAGCTDEDLYYAMTVCALFNFYNRWIDASGVHALSDEGHRAGARRSAKAGYVR